MLFWLGKKILDATAGIVAATAYAMLAASPSMLGLAGHATHFAAFFATAGLCAMWQARQNGNGFMAFVSGLLFRHRNLDEATRRVYRRVGGLQLCP